MLYELYQYAMVHKLAAQPGFKPKKVKAYVSISAKGEFLSVLVREKDAPQVYAPDIGSAANGTRYCNFLVEKAKIPLKMIEDEKTDKNVPAKYDFFLSMLDDGGSFEPKFTILAQALREEATREKIEEELARQKLKPSDPIGFRVDGAPLEESTAFLPWWEHYRLRFAPASSGPQTLCLITGEPATALATVPKVSGLFSVGGHSSGDAFLCFDKDAFQSYGLKKSANASVSEEAMTAVNAALTDLIQKAPTLGGAKIVHWYSCEVPEDPLDDIFNGFGSGDWADNPGKAEVLAAQEAKSLFASIFRGERPTKPSARYYILPLSGAGGRMMVRGWYEGSFDTLYKNISQWFRDLRLTTPGGKGMTVPPKLSLLYIRLLKPGGDPAKVFSRMDAELPGLSIRIVNAIVTGAPLPEEVAVRVLRWIRSEILSSENGKFQRETLAFQFLKAWLLRVQRQKGDEILMQETINSAIRSPAYHCGRLMSVYTAIQSAAMPNVDVGLAQRYYISASTNPAFVIGKVSGMAQHYMPKLSRGLAVYYDRILSGIYADIGSQTIPGILTTQQQTEFALGYYQQRAALFTASGRSEETELTDK